MVALMNICDFLGSNLYLQHSKLGQSHVAPTYCSPLFVFLILSGVIEVNVS